MSLSTTSLPATPVPKRRVVMCMDENDKLLIYLSPPEPLNPHEQLFMDAIANERGDLVKYDVFLNSIFFGCEEYYQRAVDELKGELGNEWDHEKMRKDSWQYCDVWDDNFPACMRRITSENHCIIHWI